MRFCHHGGGLGRHLGALVLACVALSVSAAPAVRFSPEKDYSPFVYETSGGQLEGLSIDMLEAIKPLMKATVVMTPAQPLEQILEAARQGKVDLISSLRPTPERAAYLAFTAPYVEVPAVLVVRQGFNLSRLQELQGQRVAVGKGYAAEAFVRRNHARVDWQTVPDDLSGLQGLLQGRYQGVVADIASVTHAIRTHQLEGLQVAQAIGFEYPLSFAYRKELVALGLDLDAALLKLNSQTRQTIIDRWIDPQALSFEDSKRTVVRWAGLGLAGLGVGVWAWYALRRRFGRGRV